MCSKHRLEDVTAMNNEGDEVIVKRVYEPKSSSNLTSNIGGNIYQPSNQIIVDGQVIGLTLDNFLFTPK